MDMKLRQWLRSGKPQYIGLWTIAMICVGLALAGVSIGGIGPVMLAVIATVAAAQTTRYRRKTNCRHAEQFEHSS